ncbi:MAG: carboxylesterase/lipase family protein [Deltaproteobacteria bacterium]|nr:carboxylesterase/lipase family protein [Deltaproteobacteria bacterium]
MTEITEPIVTTTAGKIEGLEQDGLYVFKGIPFAAPPVGDQRWLAPAPPEAWDDVRPVKTFGNIAPQNPSPLELLPSAEAQAQSEDCLYLNVWTPGLNDARRPAMVWVHGGAFVMGSGSSPLYEGSALSKRGDAVIVTINYRLGPFGFLNLSEVTGGRIPASGNEGLLDIIAALEWVRDNIEKFGGNPENVTLFGQSAGAMAIGALLAMPKARGLFHKAVLQSGSNTVHPYDRSVKVAERFLEALGVTGDDVDTLCSLPVEKWLAATATVTQTPGPEIGVMPMQPVVDGKLLYELPLDAAADDLAEGIPMMIGSNLEEWKLISGADPVVANLDEERLLKLCGVSTSVWDIPGLVSRYRTIREKYGQEVTPKELYMAIQTDRIYRMPAIRFCGHWGRRGLPAYIYTFDWESPILNGLLGACHALELGFVFGTYGLAENFFGSGPEAAALAANMQDAWLAFARTGDPNCGGLGGWPVYGDRRETMILGKKCAIEEAPYEELRSAWDSVPNAVLGFL